MQDLSLIHILAVPRDSVFAGKKMVSLTELDGEVLVESSFSKCLVEELMEQFPFRPRRIIPDDGTEMRREEMFHRVMVGVGASINPGRDITAFRGSNIAVSYTHLKRGYGGNEIPENNTSRIYKKYIFPALYAALFHKSPCSFCITFHKY